MPPSSPVWHSPPYGVSDDLTAVLKGGTCSAHVDTRGQDFEDVARQRTGLGCIPEVRSKGRKVRTQDAGTRAGQEDSMQILSGFW